MLAALTGEVLGIKYVPIQYEIDGKRRRVVVPGIMEIQVEGVIATGHDEVMEITNVRHPMGTSLAVAKADHGHYDEAQPPTNSPQEASDSSRSSCAIDIAPTTFSRTTPSVSMMKVSGAP